MQTQAHLYKATCGDVPKLQYTYLNKRRFSSSIRSYSPDNVRSM